MCINGRSLLAPPEAPTCVRISIDPGGGEGQSFPQRRENLLQLHNQAYSWLLSNRKYFLANEHADGIVQEVT